MFNIFNVTKEVRCELKPPKKLHRVVAGFYNYHPSYDTDKPAMIKSTKPVLNFLESKPKIYHFHKFHQEHDHGGNYNYHDYLNKGIKVNSEPDYPAKPKKYQTGYSHYKTHYSKYKDKSVKIGSYTGKNGSKTKGKIKGNNNNNNNNMGHHHYRYQHHHQRYYVSYWPYFSKLFETYILLARQMAEYYGAKYHYPVNLLYVSIVVVVI